MLRERPKNPLSFSQYWTLGALDLASENSKWLPCLLGFQESGSSFKWSSIFICDRYRETFPWINIFEDLNIWPILHSSMMWASTFAILGMTRWRKCYSGNDGTSHERSVRVSSGSECDEYIRIFEYSNIYSDIRSNQFFFYEYIRTFVRVKFVCTNIFGHSLVNVLECKTKTNIRIYSNIHAIFNTNTYSHIRSCQKN